MYQSLYRKYRPQTFSEIYGQDGISQTLTNAIIYDRVAHAYLFSGPRGTGKTSTAKLLAKALNCTNIVDGRICDKCEDCLLIKNNNHPDVVEIDAASNNGVDEVRDLIEKVKYAPIKGKKKVYIIDEVHMMTQGAFNALLKTLEDPPEHVVFILATTEQHKILATIKSRCQKFNFKKLSEKDIIACLENILKQEACHYEPEALSLIASLCDGGMRDALSITEQVMIYSSDNITVVAVNEALDLVAQDKIAIIYDYLLALDLNGCLAYVKSLAQSSIDYNQVMSDLVKKAMAELLELKNQREANNKQAYLLNMIEKFDESLDRLKYDNNKKLYLDLAIIKTINYQNSTEKIGQKINEEQVNSKIVVDEIITESVIDPILEQRPANETSPTELESVLNQEEGNDEVIFEKDDSLVPESDNEEKPLDNQLNNLIDEDELMNVLVQASRDDLEFVKKKWELLEDYLININTKQNASLLIESIPVAASANAIIVVCKDLAEVSLINDPGKIPGMANFVAEIMGEARYCFAATPEDWKKLRDKYLQLRQVNRLPEAKQLLRGMILTKNVENEEVEVKDELLDFGKTVFKDKLIIKREGENTNGY